MAGTNSKKAKSKVRKTDSKKGKKNRIRAKADKKPLSALTQDALQNYFSSLNGHKPGDLYQLVIGEVEKPLLASVLEYTNGNQSAAADVLGINRGTLRKKLRAYNLVGE